MAVVFHQHFAVYDGVGDAGGALDEAGGAAGEVMGGLGLQGPDGLGVEDGEVGGVALALQLAAGTGPLMWMPVAAFAVWLVIWRVRFSVMENVTGAEESFRNVNTPEDAARFAVRLGG